MSKDTRGHGEGTGKAPGSTDTRGHGEAAPSDAKVPTPVVAEEATDKGIITRAAALRVKYLLQKVRLVPGIVGFHPENRNGDPPMGNVAWSCFT